MTTCHGGTEHTAKDRHINSHIDIATKEDTRGIDIGPNNDNESPNSSDTMLAFGGSEVDSHLSNLLPSSQANLTVFTRKINSLHQWMEAIEGRLAEGLDHIEWELENLSLMLRA